MHPSTGGDTGAPRPTRAATLSGSGRVFLCSFRVSVCHGATVTRHCTTGQPDQYECAECGAMAAEASAFPQRKSDIDPAAFSVFDGTGNLMDAFDTEEAGREYLALARETDPDAFLVVRSRYQPVVGFSTRRAVVLMTPVGP